LIKVNLNYTSNFNVNISSNNLLKKKIFCKNFIIFLMFLNFFKKNNISVFFKPIFKRSFDILKAPYRFKMSKNQLYFSRFDILISFFFNKHILVSNHKNILFFYKYILKFFLNFEVNICLQNSIKVFFTFRYRENFLIN
jgi:hypothetical protein